MKFVIIIAMKGNTRKEEEDESNEREFIGKLMRMRHKQPCLNRGGKAKVTRIRCGEVSIKLGGIFK